jgi:Family of unknown function (DUF6788)
LAFTPRETAALSVGETNLTSGAVAIVFSMTHNCRTFGRIIRSTCPPGQFQRLLQSQFRGEGQQRRGDYWCNLRASPSCRSQVAMDCFAKEQRASAALELAKTLYKTPALVRHGVRCGKAVCRCQRGELHGPYAFLYWRDAQGKQRRCYVRQADVAAVEQLVTQRRAADRAARRRAVEAAADLRQLRRWLRELERDGTW